MIFQECKTNSWEIKWNVLITASLFRNDVKFKKSVTYTTIRWSWVLRGYCIHYCLIHFIKHFFEKKIPGKSVFLKFDFRDSPNEAKCLKRACFGVFTSAELFQKFQLLSILKGLGLLWNGELVSSALQYFCKNLFQNYAFFSWNYLE